MKMLSAVVLAGVLGVSAAFAAGNGATTHNETEGKAMSSKACNKQADEKKLTGDARASFVKDCRAGKSAAAK